MKVKIGAGIASKRWVHVLVSVSLAMAEDLLVCYFTSCFSDEPVDVDR